MEETKKNEPLSRSVRIKLTPAVAKVLLRNQAKATQLQAALQSVVAMDQELVGALAADAGHKLMDYQRWDYEDGKDGATYLVLVPPPLPMPPPPQPPQPKQTPEQHQPPGPQQPQPPTKE